MPFFPGFPELSWGVAADEIVFRPALDERA